MVSFDNNEPPSQSYKTNHFYMNMKYQVSKEELKKLSLSNTIPTISEILNIPIKTLRSYFKKFNIVQDKKLIKKLSVEKQKRTNLERYGCENVGQNLKIKEKISKTFLMKYGGNPNKTNEVKNKVKATQFKKYGRFAFNDINKVTKTNIKKYGTKWYNQCDEGKKKLKESYKNMSKEKKKSILENRKKTNLKKYGEEYAIMSPKVRKKVQKTYKIKYGGHPSTNKKIMQKIISSINKTYADKDKKEKIISQIKNTNIQKFGVDHPLKLDSKKKKLKSTLLSKYGVDNISKLPEVKKKKEKTSIKHYGTKSPLQNEEIRDRIKQTNILTYGVPYTILAKQFRKNNRYYNTAPNKKFAKLLDNNKIKYDREFSLCGKLFDFKVNNLLLEINPSVTHNINWCPFTPDHKSKVDKNYHLNKTQIGLQNNYHTIHIWDWDNQEKIINTFIKTTNIKIYARQCKVLLVDKAESKKFLNTYHIQNKCNGIKISIGLYYKNKLVSIMCFGKSRYTKKYEYELLRYCSNSNVIGGAEKLFKYFLDNYKPKSIISYCDLSKFEGKVYEKLKFVKLNNSLPTRHWYHPKLKLHITDNLLRQRGFDQLVGKYFGKYGKGTNNEELMLKHGFVEIYDCGQGVYVWEE